MQWGQGFLAVDGSALSSRGRAFRWGDMAFSNGGSVFSSLCMT